MDFAQRENKKTCASFAKFVKFAVKKLTDNSHKKQFLIPN